MKLYLMKKDALETLKANLPSIYGKYYSEPTNKWIKDICGEDPFIEFMDVPEFALADLDAGLTPGEIDLNNCKILYEKLIFLSESQASDERLWAGLTNGTFYEYMRKRWKYGYGKKPQAADKEAGAIKSRYFYQGSGRSGFYRNTLSKCWWVGHNTYDSSNTTNHFEALDIIGSNDINSKINEFFYNFTFSSNPTIRAAIIEALKNFRADGKKLIVKEHIRPAMSYLNAVGGSLVLDCLEKDEITDIFSSAVEAIMQGDTPTLTLDNPADEDDYSEEDASSIPEILSVTLGCHITIRNDDGAEKTYSYDLDDRGKLKPFLSIFNGRKEGDIVEINEKEWTIEKIFLKNAER